MGRVIELRPRGSASILNDLIGALNRRRVRPYCNGTYYPDQSVKYLNTRECLAAQTALREAK